MKKNYLKQITTLAIMLILSLAVQAQWTQIGTDIDGEAADDWSSCSVSLSSDGSVLAVGAYGNDGNSLSSGHVRIFKNIAGTWTQLGNDIDGEAAGDHFGWSVKLSTDGTIVAIGAILNDGNGSDAGHVRIYEYVAGTWAQIGNDIEGEAAGDNSGYSLSLSSDGSVIAIGAFQNDGNGTDAGHVRIYKNIANTWTQIGNDINGEAAGNYSGSSVSLSSDGSVLAIGAYGNDDGGNYAGHVRIYKDSSGTWSQIGADIDGEAAIDNFGWSVSLSANGSVVAIGAMYNDGNGTDAGHVRIYKNIANTWTQLGVDIDGEAAENQSGFSVSLSDDGSVVAIGAPWDDGNGTDAGHVRIYKNISGTWTQLGNDIDGEAVGDFSGYSVSLSADGSIIAIGAILNDGNGNNAGHVRIYTNPSVGVTELNNTPAISLYPNPTKGKLTIQCKDMQQLEILDITGKLIYKAVIANEVKQSPINTHQINISTYSKGVYLVKVTTTEAVAVERIVLE